MPDRGFLLYAFYLIYYYFIQGRANDRVPIQQQAGRAIHTSGRGHVCTVWYSSRMFMRGQPDQAIASPVEDPFLAKATQEVEDHLARRDLDRVDWKALERQVEKT
jgi:hypothetical protein